MWWFGTFVQSDSCVAYLQGTKYKELTAEGTAETLCLKQKMTFSPESQPTNKQTDNDCNLVI